MKTKFIFDRLKSENIKQNKWKHAFNEKNNEIH